MIEIGRIDVATEVSMLSSHLAYPREGHLEAALHVMVYLKGRPNSRLAMDPSYPTIDEESSTRVPNGNHSMGMLRRPFLLMPFIQRVSALI